jgi:hypothetical protein
MWYLTVIFKHLVGVLSQIGTESNKFSRHVTLDWCFRDFYAGKDSLPSNVIFRHS